MLIPVWFFCDSDGVHTTWVKKGDTILLSISLLNIDRISQFFLSWNCVIKLLIKIPPHLRCVATLPCEMFQQDSAPAHRASETIKLLQRETPAFISPDLWPPNSPDLNPVNHKICGVMQDRVYQKKSEGREWVDRERLVEVWAGLQQNVIDDAIDQWRRRLRACVRARGGHFEWLLWLTALAIPRIWFVKFVENLLIYR